MTVPPHFHVVSLPSVRPDLCAAINILSNEIFKINRYVAISFFFDPY